MTTSALEGAALVRLLQLASPTLPVGGFSYSQGLEVAVEQGRVRDVTGAAEWIGTALDGPLGVSEAGFLLRMLRAWETLVTEAAPAAATLASLDALFQASRESQQLLAETRQMAWSLLSLLDCLPSGHLRAEAPALLTVLRQRAAQGPCSYPMAWSCAAVACGIPAGPALTAYLWSWLENQVMAALKTVPLGQSAGQALLLSLGSRVPALVDAALKAGANRFWPEDDDVQDCGPGNLAPGFALACTDHETLYSRLFRS